MPKNGENWGKLIVAKGFKKLPTVQKIARSGHTDGDGKLFSPLLRAIVLETFSLLPFQINEFERKLKEKAAKKKEEKKDDPKRKSG